MSNYIHGTDPDEQRRLSQLNEELNDRCLREIPVKTGDRVLDVGSGLGQLSRALARAGGPKGHVLGIERSDAQIAEATRQAREAGEEALVEFRRGDAVALPLKADEWGTFDLAHARFVLEHISDPLQVIRQMVRAVRSGGKVVLIDDDHEVLRLWPEPVSFPLLWTAYMRSYDRLGNDPHVGKRAIHMLHEAGAKPARVSQIFFGGCSGMSGFEAWSNNLVHIISQSRETAVKGGLIDAETFDAAIEGIKAWSRRPDAAAFYGVAYSEAVKP
jgi:ubiquinone/menaquinone biosynthesis C-methylase UbiE